jgi:hypothetical protein
VLIVNYGLSEPVLGSVVTVSASGAPVSREVHVERPGLAVRSMVPKPLLWSFFWVDVGVCLSCRTSVSCWVTCGNRAACGLVRDADRVQKCSSNAGAGKAPATAPSAAMPAAARSCCYCSIPAVVRALAPCLFSSFVLVFDGCCCRLVMITRVRERLCNCVRGGGGIGVGVSRACAALSCESSRLERGIVAAKTMQALSPWAS